MNVAVPQLAGSHVIERTNGLLSVDYGASGEHDETVRDFMRLGGIGTVPYPWWWDPLQEEEIRVMTV